MGRSISPPERVLRGMTTGGNEGLLVSCMIGLYQHMLNSLALAGLLLLMTSWTGLFSGHIPMQVAYRLSQPWPLHLNCTSILLLLSDSARTMIFPLDLVLPEAVKSEEKVWARAPIMIPIEVAHSPINSFFPYPSSSYTLNYTFYSFSK